MRKRALVLCAGESASPSSVATKLQQRQIRVSTCRKQYKSIPNSAALTEAQASSGPRLLVLLVAVAPINQSIHSSSAPGLETTAVATPNPSNIRASLSPEAPPRPVVHLPIIVLPLLGSCRPTTLTSRPSGVCLPRGTPARRLRSTTTRSLRPSTSVMGTGKSSEQWKAMVSASKKGREKQKWVHVCMYVAWVTEDESFWRPCYSSIEICCIICSLCNSTRPAWWPKSVFPHGDEQKLGIVEPG